MVDFHGFTPDPMPVFVIKAQDKFALRVIDFYRQLCIDEDLMPQAIQVTRAFVEMNRWQARNPEQVKAPYHEHVPVHSVHASDDAVPPAYSARPASAADTVDMRRLGDDGVADRLGVEPVRTEGADYDALRQRLARVEHELARVCRLLDIDPNGSKVDLDHATEESSQEGGAFPQ